MLRRLRANTLPVVMFVAILAVLAGLWTRGTPPEPNIALPASALRMPPFPKAKPLQPPPVFTRPAGRPTRVAVLGDSLSNAWFATVESHGWAQTTISRLNQSPPGAVQVPVPNGRKPGELTTTRVFLGFAPKDVDLALVELGTNDYNQLKPAGFRAQYSALLKQLRAASPQARVVCLGPWQGAARVNKFRYPETSYDRVVRTECESVNGTYIRISGIFGGPGNRGPKGAATFVGPNDGFHPNDKGHLAIADAISTALAGKLPKT